jgi:hypothetical protein
MIEERKQEAVTAGAVTASSVINNMQSAERAKLGGVYHLTCMTPEEPYRERMIQLQLALGRAEQLKDYWSMDVIQAQIDKIPKVEKWRDDVHNLVTDVGANDLLDKYLAGSAYTAAWYLGLVDGGSAPSYAAGNTMASHAGWTENVGYSNANRPTPSFGAAAARAKATSATVFNINATGTIAGCFLASNSTKSGTTGILYSCGNFTTGGSKSVASGDTLSVTYTASA